MNKLTAIIIATTAISLSAPSAFAADAERNDRLYDASGSSVAKVKQITSDGDLIIIYKGKVRRIQSETLSNNDGKLMTTLSKGEIRRLK